MPNIKIAAPVSPTAAATANAQKYSPVCCTMKPVSHGAATPAKLAKPFCRLVHFPAARGPASVCVNAETETRQQKKDSPRTCILKDRHWKYDRGYRQANACASLAHAVHRGPA